MIHKAGKAFFVLAFLVIVFVIASPGVRGQTTLPTLTSTPTLTPTITPTIVPTPTLTPIVTAEPTAIAVPAATAKSNLTASSTRPLKYYMADRVLNNADFATLAGWGINTAMVAFDVNGNSADWKAVFTEAAKYNINIVVWPSDWKNPRPNCDWEAPYPVSATGDITRVKPLLDVASQYSNFIGILNGHESFWTCKNMTFDEMAGLKTQLKDYALSKGRSIKIWNYINGIYWESMFPSNQISRVMDVAIIWKHCAGNVEGTCDTGSDSALAQIKSDRARLNAAGLDGTIDLVYLMQTFAMSGYTTKFTLSEIENYSCEFLNTSALDGFAFYTWDAGWWSDLHSWPELQPAVKIIHDSCVNSSAVSTSAPATTPAPVLGDANGDSKVNETDYNIWLAHYGTAVSGSSNGDFNNNGKVDGVDYDIWLINYAN